MRNCATQWIINPMGAVSGTFMMINDDGNDGNNLNEQLISPVINCGNYENIILDCDGCFNSVFTGTPYPNSDYLNVEVFDGSTWQQVGTFPTYDDDIGFGATGPYDVSSYADGNPDFQIRLADLMIMAPWTWGAIIDNVKLLLVTKAVVVLDQSLITLGLLMLLSTVTILL